MDPTQPGRDEESSKLTHTKPPQPASTLQTDFVVSASPEPEHDYRDRLLDAGALAPALDGLPGVFTLSIDPNSLHDITPGKPILRHQYPQRFFEESILTGRTKLEADRAANYQLEVHPVHAFCFESSRVASLVAKLFPEIKDPVIVNLVAGLMITAECSPSLTSFGRCFRRPLQDVTQDRLDQAYAIIQDARPSRAVILRNQLATTQRAHQRSRNEVREMGDGIFDPHIDPGDVFNVEHVLDRGISITVKREVLERVLPGMLGNDSCPHAESLKLEKLFAVSVDRRPLSDGSKLALSAHDAFDHMYFFDLIHESRLAAVLLPKIANFDFSTRDNIFSMASEYLAMVPYDWRAWQEIGADHNRPVEPILRAAREALRAGLDRGEIPLVARIEVEQLLSLPDDHPRMQQFGFTLRGIMWENGEMAIKWGPLDLKPLETAAVDHPEPWGPAPILSHPCYLAFVVCALDSLNNPDNQAIDVLQKINNTLEHHLMKAIEKYSESDEPYQFTLRVSDLHSVPTPDVPQNVRDWFKEHIGFAAVRAPLCD